MMKAATTSLPLERARLQWNTILGRGLFRHVARPASPQWMALAAAALILGFEPVKWLVGTWFEPAYASNGAVVFLLVAGLAVWSLTSPVVVAGARAPWFGLALLGASALARLAGQVFAINTLGALTLVIDVFALAILLRLDQRVRAVSPAWLAIAFAFSLPLERIAQRTIGYVLQHASADGACVVLSGLFEEVQCAGVRLLIDNKDVLVDLPCSGARTVLLTLFGFVLVAAYLRPGARLTVLGLVSGIVSAYVANVLRITVLSIGIAKPELLGGINVMVAPWHDAIGLAALVLSFLPVLMLVRMAEPGLALRKPSVGAPQIPDRVRNDGWWLETGDQQVPSRAGAMSIRWPIVGGLLFVALVIVNLPRQPMDVARTEAQLVLPSWISGQMSDPVPLLPQEAAYFTQFGGASAKAAYGPHNLLVVRTTSPLRHLHAPDECLRGLGFSVRYVGLQHGLLPTAVYVATAPHGQSYRIDVSFVSENGQAVANVASAVWLWLNGKAPVWRAIHRISPLSLDPDRHAQWSAAALTALGDARPKPVQTAANVSQTSLNKAKGEEQ